MLHIVERLNLIHAAVDVLRERHLLVEAAAGYGKSVLLKQLLSYLPDSDYVQLTVDDNDVVVLGQRIRGTGATIVLVDDVHNLAFDSEAAGWLKAKLTSSTPRILLAGRHMPFAATVAIASDEAVRWDERDLTFSGEIVAQLLNEADAGPNAWRQQLGGWPMAVGLLQQLPPDLRRPATLHSGLFEYLAQAVFERLPVDLKRFMQVTAVPIEFSADLATHLLDGRATYVETCIATVQRRNLFLTEGNAPEHFRYHDLFRDFLLAQGTAAERQRVALETVMHLNSCGHYAMAVEQALESGLYERTAALLLDLDWEFLHSTNRYRTFDRWVMSLAPDVRDANPALYWMAGHCLIYLRDRERDAFAYFERSEALALEADESATVYAARYEHAHLRYMLYGASAELAGELAQIAAEAPDDQKSGLRARRTLSSVQAELGRFREARATWQTAYKQAQQMAFNEMLLEMMKRQYALYILTPLGAFAEARAIFSSAIEHTAGSPGNQLEVLANYCDVLLAMGAWDEMEATRARIRTLAAEVDDIADYLQVWLHYYDGMLALARNAPQRAAAHFSAMEREEDDGLVLICARIGRISLARQTGAEHEVMGWLEEADAHKQNAPYYAATAHLEADIARGLAAVAAGRSFRVSAGTLALYRFRARGDLLRLRALLTVLCYEEKQPRWQRMARIVLRELQQPHYEQLLMQRDPQLGAYFWRVLLVENISTDRAVAALAACGIVEPLLPLLNHDTPRVRADCAQVLAQIGNERAMSALSKALAAEKDRPTRRMFAEALEHLERQPPPLLAVQLMGSFDVQRGDTAVDDFHRPIVARLLQFFAVHRGRPLARELILEALWPDTNPEKAWRTFRTVYSRLRSALEPHMRSKGPNRYFSLDGDSYTFDPHGYVTVDIEQWRRNAIAGLATEELRAHLEAYQPVLPELGSVDWLLEVREQMQELYVTGCLRLGEQLLARGAAPEAQRWAQRVIRTAPWLEAAYQLLMRAYARQNLRSRALRAYEEACVALQNELGVDPAPLTVWLYTRLQKGESI